MKVQIVSKTGAGSTSPIVVNTNTSPCNIGFGVVVDGTVDYTVQHTFDDPATGFTTWFSHPTIAGQSTNKDGNYAFPVTGIRLTVNSGGGTATLNLVQAGIA
ncbi:hypothetical protein EB001_04665 [bacterium]|nr:hypothetical protein [bacterium]